MFVRKTFHLKVDHYLNFLFFGVFDSPSLLCVLTWVTRPFSKIRLQNSNSFWYHVLPQEISIIFRKALNVYVLYLFPSEDFLIYHRQFSKWFSRCKFPKVSGNFLCSPLLTRSTASGRDKIYSAGSNRGKIIISRPRQTCFYFNPGCVFSLWRSFWKKESHGARGNLQLLGEMTQKVLK